MGKKLASGIFAGLLGAGLYAAYQKLDEDKKNRMKKNLREKSDELRDRAVDYAFYANDAMSDFKDVLKDEMDQAKGNVKDASSKFSEKAKTFTDNQQETEDGNAEKSQDDIVVDATEAFKNSGIPSADDDLNEESDEPSTDNAASSDAAKPDGDGAPEK